MGRAMTEFAGNTSVENSVIRHSNRFHAMIVSNFKNKKCIESHGELNGKMYFYFAISEAK